MTTCWHIREWEARYEVNDQGRPVNERGRARAGRLPWVRSKVNGRSQGEGYRRLVAVCNDPAKLVGAYAVFMKMLEIAADGPRGQRGWILNGEGGPATAEDIAFYTSFPLETVRVAMEALSNPRVRWIEPLPCPFLQDPTGSDRKLEEPSGNSPERETEREVETETQRNGDAAAPSLKGRVASGFDPMTLAVPASLDTPAFRQWWSEWVADRGGRKPWTRAAAELQLAKLKGVGPAAAISAIRVAIESGWPSVFPSPRNEAREGGRRSNAGPVGQTQRDQLERSGPKPPG